MTWGVNIKVCSKIGSLVLSSGHSFVIKANDVFSFFYSNYASHLQYEHQYCITIIFNLLAEQPDATSWEWISNRAIFLCNHWTLSMHIPKTFFCDSVKLQPIYGHSQSFSNFFTDSISKNAILSTSWLITHSMELHTDYTKSCLIFEANLKIFNFILLISS